jgi:hypothetical protein
MKRMTPEARALAQVLLEHHAAVCAAATDFNSCLIFYSSLCERAGVPYLTRGVGPFLREVADWCATRGWPPINALAVSRDTHMPGEGYDGAPGCSLLTWPAEAEAALTFKGYPPSV